MARSSRRAYPTDHRDDISRVLQREWNDALLPELDEIRSLLTGTVLITPTVLSIGSTDDRIATTAFTFAVFGVAERKAAVAAGTVIPAETVTADKWALYRLSVAAGGAITVTPAAGNVAGYNTEALAIAALPATPANEVDLGYFTVLTEVGSAWVADTDALAGGAAGNPASETNYYPASSALAADSASTKSIRATR